MILRCFYPSDVRRGSAQYLSRPPRNRAELDSASEIILGHFTSSKFLASIKTNGLIPDIKKERAMDDNLPSDETSVYLLTTFDRFYMNRAVKFHGGEALIIEVKVPRRTLQTSARSEMPVKRCIARCVVDNASIWER